MRRSALWCIATILAVLILFAVTLKVFALSPAQTIPLPPLPELPYTDEELNMMANVVNGEVGSMCGEIVMIFSDGTERTVDGDTIRMIHALVLDNQVHHAAYPDSLRTCISWYWSDGYTGTSWGSSAQWRRCRENVIFALWGFVDVPDGVVAATCDPWFADKYTAYRLWAKVKWDTGWTSGTFYYYQYGG